MQYFSNYRYQFNSSIRVTVGNCFSLTNATSNPTALGLALNKPIYEGYISANLSAYAADVCIKGITATSTVLQVNAAIKAVNDIQLLQML